MNVKHLGLVALASVGLLMASSANAADYSFDFVANDSSYSVSGILSTANVQNAVSGFDVTSITGTVSGFGGGAITALVTNPGQPYPTNNGAFIYNNVLFPATAPVIDNNGILFQTGASTWNLYSYSANSYALYSWENGVGEKLGNMSIAAVPEPETYAMMVAGLGLLGLMVRRKKQSI